MRERDHLGDPDVNGRIILGRIFRKRDGNTDCIDLAQEGQVAGSCKWGNNEPSGCVK
jgi:hypothetical protein